jgi:pilus assembly protein CpaC
MAAAQGPAPAPNSIPLPPAPAISYRLHGANDRLQMIVNTSRILTIGQKIPQAQVNDPAVVGLTALSPTEVQVYAKKPGVTQVNLWGEDQKIYSVDLIVFGDAQELNMIIRQEFPNSTVRAITMSKGVLLSGYVDQPEHISRIVQIAEQFYSKDTVINNITVGGVQLVLLHVKLMEVSRTKLRTLGFDWAKLTNGNLVVSSVSGLITDVTAATNGTGPVVTTTGEETFAFAIGNGSSAFFGVLEALRQDNLAKILADPTLVTISGRAAFFHVGGKFPYLVPQGNNSISTDWMDYGTRVDFVPIVLGNGRIHLDVRPEVSEPDTALGVSLGTSTIPAVKTRTAETGVEMTAGQTLAIAGLIQSRDEAVNRGLPWVSELPYIGALFRRVQHEYNDIELLILVTPELVEAMDAQEVPPCGPGMRTTRPDDCDLYFRGHLEVPNCCPTCAGAGCAACSNGQLPPPAEREPGLIQNATQLSGSRADRPRRAAVQAQPGFAVDRVTTGGGVPMANGQIAPGARPQNRQNRANSSSDGATTADRSASPAFIGPTGYQAR